MGFSEYILKDLINEGYEPGIKLEIELMKRKSQINHALHAMIKDTRDNRSYTSID